MLGLCPTLAVCVVLKLKMLGRKVKLYNIVVE
jgi:hypothetical protein